MRARTVVSVLWSTAALSIVFGMWNPFATDGNLLRGQGSGSMKFEPDPYVELRAAGADNVSGITAKFHIDPWWPRPLPNDWVFGPIFGVCVNSKDRVFIVQRTEEGPGEAGPWQGNKYGLPVLAFDPQGRLVSSWGDPKMFGGCSVDHQDNVWISNTNDSIVQKFSPDGKQLLLTIGVEGKSDTSDGTAKGKALNASQTLLNRPLAVAVDPATGDVYIADGAGNRRVAVFDRAGKFLRQLGRQATKEEAEAGAGGAFTGAVNSVTLSKDGLLYAGDRDGKRIQVFDKMGNFKMNISVPRRRKDLEKETYQRGGVTISPSLPGKAEIYGVLLSTDRAQKYLYVATPESLIWTVERQNGKPISAFGRKGYGTGEMQFSNFTNDSKGDIIVGSMNRGVQMFRAIGSDDKSQPREQARGGTPKFRPDPYVRERAAGADTVPRITARFHVDPWWPKPLPNDWVLGATNGVCVDSKDHVFAIGRGADRAGELNDEGPWQGNRYAPPVVEWDAEGNVVNSWGDPKDPPAGACYVDYADNIWVGGAQGSVVQKYSHDGKQLLLTIGVKGKYDTSDGTARGKPLNSSRELLNRPTDYAVDPSNGDVYIADGNGNRRIVVFDRNGKYIRQFGRQATKEDAEAGVGGAFTGTMNNLSLSKDGLLYVSDRDGKRVQVFDKMGNSKMNISVPRRRKELQREIYHREGLAIQPSIPDKSETAGILFSPDPAQKYLYVGTVEGLIWTIDRASGKLLAAFGQKGYGVGEIRISNVAINSKGDLFIVAANRGIEKFGALGED